MRLSGFGWVNSMKNLLRLCLCLVLVGIITAGAIGYASPSSTGSNLPAVQVCLAEPLQQNDAGYAPFAIAGDKPDIQVWKANPMELDSPTSAAVYTYKVKRATKVQINEAGANLKNISNPSGATLQGTANGLPASAITTDASGQFVSTITATNENGSVQAELTLSLSEKLLASRLPAEQADETGSQDGQDGKHKPWWGPLMYHPVTAGPPTTTTRNEPEFFECPSDCDNCLRPDEAAKQGFGQKCSEERCYYSPDNKDNWFCYRSVPGWCCKDLKVFQSAKNECLEVGGVWSTSQTEALERCQQACWCCANGKVFQSTQSQCAQYGGTCYFSQGEALERCQQACWCCANGKVFQSTQSQCAQYGGICYFSQGEALERCQTPTCWCCANGQVFQTTQSQCAQSGGNCYNTQTEASRACQTPTCWCCANGQVFQTTQSQCIQVGGNCYTSQGEALERCQPPTCWCCANGKVFQTTQSQCAQYGGICYSTQGEALERCQPPTCWCCANGKVFQTTQSQCAQYGGICYSTQGEALERCKTPVCWCCANGQVFQSTQSQCTKSGGTCYSSYEEAQRYCRKDTPYLR